MHWKNNVWQICSIMANSSGEHNPIEMSGLCLTTTIALLIFASEPYSSKLQGLTVPHELGCETEHLLQCPKTTLAFDSALRIRDDVS